MLSQTNPRLRRNNVVFHSFGSCALDASEKLSRTPEAAFPEIPHNSWMFMQQLKGTTALKQLQGSADTHRGRQLNEEIGLVHSDVQPLDFTPVSLSSFVQSSLTISSNAKELEMVSGIVGFLHEVECILSKRMPLRFKIHFFSLTNSTINPAHAKFARFIPRDVTAPLHINNSKELNVEGSNSFLGFKTEVSSLQI